jgi:hypothetical protein
MHSHVRSNAHVYTPADLAMTVLDFDHDTLQEVSLAPDNHSGSSGANADSTKEIPSPIPIREALKKLGLQESPRCGNGIVAPPVRTVLSSKRNMDGFSKLEKLRQQQALYHQPIRHAHRMRLNDVHVVYAYCEIFPIPEECEDTTAGTSDGVSETAFLEESFDCRVVCKLRREVHASARKRPPALVEIPDEEDDS